MAALNTDFASEPETCGSDTKNASDMAERQNKAGLGAATNKSVGQVWRSVDGVNIWILEYIEGSLRVCSMSPSSVG